MRGLKRVLCLVLVVPLLSGCRIDVPTVCWLPDSSGFLFLDEHDDPGAILHYDLKRKASRTIKLKGSVSSAPDVTRDGKKIACLLRSGKYDDERLCVVVLDLAGQEVHRSKFFIFPRVKTTIVTKDGKTQEREEDPNISAHLEWFPHGGKILVSGGNVHAVYDVANSTITPFETGETFALAKMLGVTSRLIRPDGAGYYYAAKGSLFFKDLEGWKKRHDLSTLEKYTKDQPLDKILGDGTSSEIFFRVAWKKNALSFSVFSRAIGELDVDKLAPSLNFANIETTRKERKENPGLGDKIVLAGDEIAVRVVTDREDKDKPKWIEIEKIKDKKTKRLFRFTEWGILCASPSLNHVVAFCRKQNDTRYRYVIIDNQGQILDEIVLARR